MIEHIEADLAEAAELVAWFRTNRGILVSVQQIAA